MAERQFMIVLRNEADAGEVGKNVGGAGGIKKRQGGSSSQKSSSTKKTSTSKEDKAAKALAKAIGIPMSIGGAYSTARSVHNLISSHNNSLIEVTTGSRELQERTTYTYNTAWSFIDSAVAGGITGSAFGPAGAAVGAVIGAAKAGISYAVNYAQETDAIAKQRSLENITRGLSAQRVTVSGSRYMTATQM